MDEAPDDEEQAQWMILCDDCENPVEHFCNTCGDKLCESCKQQHLSRRKNRNHEVIPYTAGVAASLASKAMCDEHTGKQVDLYCKPCERPVCSQCVADHHGDHKLTSLSDAFSLARDAATSILQTMLTEDKPRLLEEKKKASDMEERAVIGLNNNEKNMRQSAELLHKEIDSLLKTDLDKIAEIKANDILPKAQEQKQKASDRLDLLEKDIKSYEDNLRSGNPVTFLSFMRGKQPTTWNSLLPCDYKEISLPVFKSCSVDTNILRDQFGVLKLNDTETVASNVGDLNKTPSVYSAGGLCETNKKERLGTSEIRTEGVCRGTLFAKARLQTEFTVNSSDITNLCYLRLLKDGKVWIHGEGRKLLLADRSGNVLKTVDALRKIYWYTGIAVTNDNELLYTNLDECKVLKVTEQGYTKTLLTTNTERPYGICCLTNGDVIVTFAGKSLLKVFNKTGNVTKVIGKDILKWPWYVTINKENQDICVSDDTERIVVFNREGQHRFTYTGNSIGKLGFRPFDLCTDHTGNILITDPDNHRVHIIDKDGKFLQYLTTEVDGLQYPRTIDIDSKGDVLVGEWETNKVKVYKYLS